jgi:hypothetical protein
MRTLDEKDAAIASTGETSAAKEPTSDGFEPTLKRRPTSEPSQDGVAPALQRSGDWNLQQELQDLRPGTRLLVQVDITELTTYSSPHEKTGGKQLFPPTVDVVEGTKKGFVKLAGGWLTPGWVRVSEFMPHVLYEGSYDQARLLAAVARGDAFQAAAGAWAGKEEATRALREAGVMPTFLRLVDPGTSPVIAGFWREIRPCLSSEEKHDILRERYGITQLDGAETLAQETTLLAQAEKLPRSHLKGLRLTGAEEANAVGAAASYNKKTQNISAGDTGAWAFTTRSATRLITAWARRAMC